MTESRIDVPPDDTGIPAWGRDATITILAANLIGVGVFVLAAAVFVPLFLLLWDASAFVHGAIRFSRLAETIPLLAALVVIHELLHAAAFLVFARVPWSSIRFGVQWKALTPYAHCTVPVRASAYRAAVASPGLLLGVVPCIIAVAFGSGWLLIWAVLMTAAAGGDAAILWAIRFARGSDRVLDHPTKAGCLISNTGDAAPKSIPTATTIE